MHTTLPNWHRRLIFIFCRKGSSHRKVCTHTTDANYSQESAYKLAVTSSCAHKTKSNVREHACPCRHFTLFIDQPVTLFSILFIVPITACKEIHRTICRLELIVQCRHSILAKCPVRETRGILQNVYCKMCKWVK